MGKWKMVRLGDVTTIDMGQSPSSETYNNAGDGLPFFQGKADFGLTHPIARMYCSEPKKIAENNSILLSVRAPVGAVNIATQICCIGRGLAAISEMKNVSHYRYLFYYLKYKGNDIANMGVGSTFKAISRKDFDAIQLPLPPLDVQQKIADVLDKASELIELRRVQLDKLDLLIKSKFIEMFGDPEKNPMGWPQYALGEKCEIITGNTPPRADKGNYGNYIEWIKSDNIDSGSSILAPAKEYLSEKGFRLCRYVEANSILMTCIAGSLKSIGNVAIADRRVAFNQQINAVVPKNENVQFIYWMFLLSQGLIHDSINMMLKGILSKGNLSQISFAFPPIELQNKFSTFVQQVDKSKFAIQQSLSQLELNYKSLMQKCFRGEVF